MATPDQNVGMKRNLVQMWVDDPKNPERDSEHKWGVFRTIEQIYAPKNKYFGPNEMWDANTTHTWFPIIGDLTYECP
jgi:hypothetical protein